MGLPAWRRRRSGTWSGQTPPSSPPFRPSTPSAPISTSANSFISPFLAHRIDAGERARQQDVPLELILSDGSVYPRPGKWLFTGRQVDVTTGTLQVAAAFDNPGNFLRPGQYGLVRAKTEVRRGALLVPQRAVMELQGAWQVAVVRCGQHCAHQDGPGGRANRHRLADRKRSGTQRSRRCRRAPRRSKRAQRLSRSHSRPAQADRRPAGRPGSRGETGMSRAA